MNGVHTASVCDFNPSCSNGFAVCHKDATDMGRDDYSEIRARLAWQIISLGGGSTSVRNRAFVALPTFVAE